MGFLPDGSVHKRDRNILVSPRGLVTQLGFNSFSLAASGVNLSVFNGNRTFTTNYTTSTWSLLAVRRSTPRTGRFYFETINEGPSLSNFLMGVMGQPVFSAGLYPQNPLGNPAYLLAAGTSGGSTTGFINDGGVVANAASGAMLSTNAVCGCAINFDSGAMWFRVNGGAWFSGDPVAGTSPSISFAGRYAPEGQFDPCVAVYGLNGFQHRCTVRFDPSQWQTPAPAGFTYFVD